MHTHTHTTAHATHLLRQLCQDALRAALKLLNGVVLLVGKGRAHWTARVWLPAVHSINLHNCQHEGGRRISTHRGGTACTVGAQHTLFSATINGVRLRRRMFRDSMVCGSKPCMRSMTRICSRANQHRKRKVRWLFGGQQEWTDESEANHADNG